MWGHNIDIFNFFIIFQCTSTSNGQYIKGSVQHNYSWATENWWQQASQHVMTCHTGWTLTVNPVIWPANKFSAMWKSKENLYNQGMIPTFFVTLFYFSSAWTIWDQSAIMIIVLHSTCIIRLQCGEGGRRVGKCGKLQHNRCLSLDRLIMKTSFAGDLFTLKAYLWKNKPI